MSEVVPSLPPCWHKELGAVCCYFNPCHYRTRRLNYHLFRAGILATGIHLLTVELAFGDDDFELTGVDNLLQMRSRDVMWQKERLLCLGIERLAEDGFSKLAWLDADIRFQNPHWPEALARALDNVSLVQIFSRGLILGPGRGHGLERPGVVWQLHTSNLFQPRRSHLGLAWGAPTHLVRRLGLYDAAVIGGADALICYAPFFVPRNPLAPQQFEQLASALQLNSLRQAHYHEWATRFAALVHGKLGYVEGTVEALYHGMLTHRSYLARQGILADFDPAHDLRLNADRCWEWATAKPEMHRQVREYFLQRREDE